jgi:hypothetical protein
MEWCRWIRLEAVLIAGIAFASLGIHQTNRRLEIGTAEQASSGAVGSLPDGKALRVLSLGFERLVADLFWLRTVYYVGTDAAAKADYPDAERLADLVTDIDPHFHSVYVLMGSVLGGLSHDADAAIRLLEKGTGHSDYWRIYFLLGFNHFMEKENYAEGARWIQAAAERGGPPYLPLLASRLHAQGGSPEAAMAFIQSRLQHEEHPEIRADLGRRLRDLWITRDLGLIDAAIGIYLEQRGSPPADVQTLVREGFLRGAPVDPDGGTYAIENGRAVTSLEYEILRVRE